MIRSLLILLAFGVASAAGRTPCAASPETSHGPVLHLRLYNLANVPAPTLDQAISLAESIFDRAGVRTCWEHGSSDSEEAHFTDMTGASPGQHLQVDARDYLAVKIMRGEPGNAFPGALGFALPFARRGPHALVFYDRVETTSASAPASLSEILGPALAHEAGHALLESSEHSQFGLMKSRWGKADFQKAAMGALEFTPAEARVLREHARKRMTPAIAARGASLP